MTRLTITPWRFASDLVSVRQQLYRLDGETDQRRHAVDRVMAWRLRGNMPHAVESTALIVDAFIHHDNVGNSSFSIRAVYAAAFCRFVTGYCDIGRNKERSLEPSSMLDIARQIDMPLHFVALRHEATHEELPSERRLVAVCEQALQWLWKVYWSRLDDRLVKKESQPLSTEQIQQSVRFLCKHYRTLAKARLRARTQAKDWLQEVEGLVSDHFSKVNFSDEAVVIAADEIVNKNVLVPADYSLEDSMDGAFALWHNLIRAMLSCKPELMWAVVDSMLSALTAAPDAIPSPLKNAYSQWLIHFTEIWAVTSDREDLQTHYMRFCVLHLQPETTALGEHVLKSLETHDPELAYHSWAPIFEASRGRSRKSIEGDVKKSDGQEVFSGEMKWHRAAVAPGTAIGLNAATR